MKKSVLSLCITLICALSAAPALAQQGKQTVAVVMSGPEPANAQGAHRVVSGELEKVISQSRNYTAVSRSKEVLDQMAGEQVYQRSGSVDDAQIIALGKQLGVQFLCIVEISDIKGGAFYLSAQMANVETAEVVKTVTADSDLKDRREMMRVAEYLARELVGMGSGRTYVQQGQDVRRVSQEGNAAPFYPVAGTRPSINRNAYPYLSIRWQAPVTEELSDGWGAVVVGGGATWKNGFDWGLEGGLGYWESDEGFEYMSLGIFTNFGYAFDMPLNFTLEPGVSLGAWFNYRSEDYTTIVSWGSKVTHEYLQYAGIFCKLRWSVVELMYRGLFIGDESYTSQLMLGLRFQISL